MTFRRMHPALTGACGAVALLAVAVAVPTSGAARDHHQPAAAAAVEGADLVEGVQLMQIGEGWADNSVNTAIFRNDPITTHEQTQYAAYYNADGNVVIAKRELGSETWEQHVTDLTGNIRDAHNVISLGVDGEGYLHVSWDHHNNPLHYVRSTEPGGVEFTDEMPMTGEAEGAVTYPQFYGLDDGGLIFMYRDGSSGNGNLALKHYDPAAGEWTQLHTNLISGEGQRNAYPQACVDNDGMLHVSWVWRETWNVATNHDLMYARSTDGGKTWTQSDGTAYDLPITQETAEVVSEIPQEHELINQTSMCADSAGNPIIATYFRPPGEEVPQYFVVRHDGEAWQTMQASDRKTPFSLSGGGSKQIPIARPQVLARNEDGKAGVWVVFRDVDDRAGRVSVAYCTDLDEPTWQTRDLTEFPVNYWEPSYDRARWQRDGVLDLFVQASGQGDGETLQEVGPQPVYVLEWEPAM